MCNKSIKKNLFLPLFKMLNKYSIKNFLKDLSK